MSRQHVAAANQPTRARCASGWRRAVGRGVAVSVVALGGLAMSACGSDKPQQPSGPTVASVVDGRQAPGANGSNTNGKDTGETVMVPQTTASPTADTQEKIGDQSPGGGDSNGLPDGSTP